MRRFNPASRSATASSSRATANASASASASACRHQAVTIGIGLDHRHHAAARRAGANRLEVGPQRGAVDARANQPRHRNTPSA
jgi:hypothetical protein